MATIATTVREAAQVAALAAMIAALSAAPVAMADSAVPTGGAGKADGTAPADFVLSPQQIAADTWVVIGATEDFSPDNGGNIANTAFIDTGEGVIVIDTGSTRRYGEALREAIARSTRSPIREVWNTHHHPDHMLGNQAFADVPIAALQEVIRGIDAEGNAFADNVYRLVGNWAKGTEVLAPRHPLQPGVRQIGRHRLRILELSGHTGSDLAILDESTGVLFAGDLAFFNRAPATPHADVDAWLASLDRLAAMPHRWLVPGHGPATEDDAALHQTRRWLSWLAALLQDSAAKGLDPNEILALPLPPELAAIPLARRELARSIAHLYRDLEAKTLTARGRRGADQP